MEVCVSGNTTHLSDPANFKLKNLSVNGLKACLKEFISVEDTEISTTSLLISSEKSHKGSIIVREDDSIKRDNSASVKFFENHAGFLSLGKSKPCVDGVSLQEEDEAFDSSVEHCAKPIHQVHSQPAPQKQLVSAMKGTRGKHGMKPDEKVSVSWAANVYDPIPTSACPMSLQTQQTGRNEGRGTTTRNKRAMQRNLHRRANVKIRRNMPRKATT